MLKKLRKKFIFISMFAILVTISVFYLAITYSNYKKTIERADILTNIIANNDGKMPEYSDTKYTTREKEFITPESQFSTRYIVIYLDDDGNITDEDLSHIASVSDEDAEEIARYVSSRNFSTGTYSNLRYRIADTSDGKMIVMLDIKGEMSYFKNTTNRGILIIVFGLACVFVIISILSNKALKPMEANLEDQKQFVTNAGHELKTPIAIILADSEILEMSLGEDNEWLNGIKRQAIKMDKLIKGLLNMSKIENGKITPEIVEVPLQDLIDEELKDLKTLAREKKLTINYEPKDVTVNVDKNLFRQVIVILIDNAIKYTDENGTIDILIKQNKKQVRLEVVNDYSDYKNFCKDKVFDRFYRGDKSRNKEKNIGYGIGLSMAKSIVDAHNGEIYADLTKDNRVRFTVILDKNK